MDGQPYGLIGYQNRPHLHGILDQRTAHTLYPVAALGHVMPMLVGAQEEDAPRYQGLKALYEFLLTPVSFPKIGSRAR